MSYSDRQTALVIGAEGFIGQHTVRQLAAQGHTVYGTHYPAQPAPAVDGVHWLPCDVTAPGASAHWPTTCDSLIYMAQAPGWRDFPARAQAMFAVNVAGALLAAEYAHTHGLSRLIYLSSGSVYAPSAQPAREDDPLAVQPPGSFYNASKLAAEALLQPYGALFPVILLRPFSPYGLGQNPTMLIPALLARVREGRAISLHGQDGLVSNPVAVADVAETLSRCLRLDQSATLNVAGPELLTLRQIGEQMGRVLGTMPQFETQPDQTPPVIAGDTTRLQETLGWAPAISFESGLRTWVQDAQA